MIQARECQGATLRIPNSISGSNGRRTGSTSKQLPESVFRRVTAARLGPFRGFSSVRGAQRRPAGRFSAELPLSITYHIIHIPKCRAALRGMVPSKEAALQADLGLSKRRKKKRTNFIELFSPGPLGSRTLRLRSSHDMERVLVRRRRRVLSVLCLARDPHAKKKC